VYGPPLAACVTFSTTSWPGVQDANVTAMFAASAADGVNVVTVLADALAHVRVTDAPGV